ncbi:antibiotic biosynthesis monooxygenase [Sphingomonas oleivorans]|uniref:Antibiotic biosynthesis monooxygenase n=1 Tax=Sphingomonas oleivorans TaxID=1735121 RepID=A0A2T5G1H1_9SPHN|nr:antibiotic biosynthesis monooxygenase family protein [Sphingomonas oleivorans]PTQ12995.1 antibiotic biosynthesis monooxygenase [Sphingomonas oleivorans]
MVKEILEIDVKPGTETAFEQAVRDAQHCFLGAPGCHGLILHRSLEQPSRYRILIDWESVEHHMVEFRNSEAFLEWRRLAGSYFAATPRVEHLVEVFSR